MWDKCGMARSEEGLTEAIDRIAEIRDEFWHNVQVPGSGAEFNQALEYANRVGDYIDFAGLMCRDALERRESCGGHFREEYQTPEGEALRDDDDYSHVSAWEYLGDARASRHAQGRARIRGRSPLGT